MPLESEVPGSKEHQPRVIGEREQGRSESGLIDEFSEANELSARKFVTGQQLVAAVVDLEGAGPGDQQFELGVAGHVRQCDIDGTFGRDTIERNLVPS